MPEKGPSQRPVADHDEFAGLDAETYQQLKMLAHARLNGFRADMTLNCTSLVHEAFLKLRDSAHVSENDSHFMAVASLAMRQILVDYVRQKRSGKRGGDVLHVTLQESRLESDAPGTDLIELDEAIGRLAKRDPELENLVVLRFFGGLTMTQLAEALSRPKRSVERDWTRARIYLYQELSQGAG